MGFTTIVAVGGDGTVHEVVNGFSDDDLARARLAVVPAGTGMDFLRNVGLPRGARSIAELIASGQERSVDLGRAQAGENRYFVNFAETGLGAAVVAREEVLSPSWPGRVSFFLAAVRAAMAEQNALSRVAVDGAVVYDGPLVSAIVANGRYFGGGMKVAPVASVTDGWLDVLILGDFSRAELVAQIWKIYPGTHVKHPKVLTVRARQVSIEPVGPARLDLDGELYGTGPYIFGVLPSALRVAA